ncbi:MAG: hypothetical protein M1819_005922 [Sarea resinae]|nr:MAG: hypothetical protein M1819_005922 [Sarea resinae]
MSRILRNTTRIDTQGHCSSASSSFSSADPSTPSPSFFYRRPSIASSSSWEPGLSGRSSVISPQSPGPSTPKREEELSPVDLFAAEPYSSYSAAMMPNTLSERELGEVLMPFSQPFEDVATSGIGAASKSFLDFDYGEYQMSSFGQMPNPFLQDSARFVAASSTPTYDPALFRFDLTQACDFSSPLESAFTTPTSERHHPSRTVVPSQTCAEPIVGTSQTPGVVSAVATSSAPTATTSSYHSFYDRSNTLNPDSPSSSMTGYSLTPSPTRTPSRHPSTRSTRPQHHQQHHHQQHHRASLFSNPPSSTSSTTRITKLKKPSRRATQMTRYGVEAEIVGTNKVHKCKWLNPEDGSACDKAFQRQEHLKRHEKTHDGKKPFKCLVPGCPKSFSRSDNLKSHNNTHDPTKQGGRNMKVENHRSYLQ